MHKLNGLGIVAALGLLFACFAVYGQQPNAEIMAGTQGQERWVYGTMGFDNTRFFSGRIKPGEDWMKIMAMGRRDFITEINPRRTALVIDRKSTRLNSSHRCI